jgi:hypothetical protein
MFQVMVLCQVELSYCVHGTEFYVCSGSRLCQQYVTMCSTHHFQVTPDIGEAITYKFQLHDENLLD